MQTRGVVLTASFGCFASRRPKRKNRLRPPRADFSMDSSPNFETPRGRLEVSASVSPSLSSPVAKREKGMQEEEEDGRGLNFETGRGKKVGSRSGSCCRLAAAAR